MTEDLSAQPRRRFVAGFVNTVQFQGRLTFSRRDIAAAHGPTGEALEKALHRMRTAGRIQRVSRKSDFFVIVPPEFQALGAPPVEWWLDDAMKHLSLPYYVGLLTAAQWHGSSHFAVMETQVVVPANRRPLAVGRILIRFFAAAHVAAAPVETRTNTWSSVRVSTPATTLLDLIGHQTVGMDRLAMIAADLAPRISAEGLSAALGVLRSVPCAQRLGFVLEHVGAEALADIVAAWIDDKPRRAVDLEPGAGSPWHIARRWQVRVNARLEAAA